MTVHIPTFLFAILLPVLIAGTTLLTLQLLWFSVLVGEKIRDWLRKRGL